MDDNISLTRRELYDLVWTTPMEHLAKKFGLSVPGMAKLCRPHCVPVPPRGYWAELQHGKNSVRRELPPAERPNDDSVSFQCPERPLPPTSSVRLQQPLDRQQRQEIGSDPAPKAGVGRTAEADFLALIVGHPDHMVILVELEPERIGW
jgi:hypothetical protein